MDKLTGKGSHGKHRKSTTPKYIKSINHEESTMQGIGNAFEIKRPAN